MSRRERDRKMMYISEERRKLLDNLNFVSFCFGMFSVLFFMVGLRTIQNYLNWVLFSACLVLAGMVSAFVVYRVLCYFIPEASIYKNNKNVGMLFPLTITLPLIFFSSGILLNEWKPKEIVSKDYVIKDMGSSAGRHREYYVYIDNGTRLERIEFGAAFNAAHTVGDTIHLNINTGRLWFKYYEVKYP